MRDLLCRVDAGPGRGLGHLQRCLALAEALRQRDVGVRFLTPPGDHVSCRIQAAGFEWIAPRFDAKDAGGPRDWMSAIDAAQAHGCRGVIVDSYDIADDYLLALRGAALRVVALDDLAAHASAAHVVVNGAAGAETLRYESSTGDTRFLLGARYALLHKAFWEAGVRVPASTMTRVLVSVGGGDPHGALPGVLRALDALDEDVRMTAVVGPFAAEDDPELVAERYQHRVEFVRAPESLRMLMETADVAVSAGGQTLCELAAMGVPTIAIQLFDNQSMNVRGLADAGVVLDAGNIDDAGFTGRLTAAAMLFARDHAARVRSSRAGQALIDGRGAARVAEAILTS